MAEIAAKRNRIAAKLQAMTRSVLRRALAVALALSVPLRASATPLPAPPDLGDGLPVASPAGAGHADDPLQGLPAAIVRGDFPKTTSVLVVRDGALVYEGYFGDGGPNVLNDTRSATKSITAIAMGVAIAEGAIPSERALAFPYLADLKPFREDTADKQAIRINDLLTMSSALDCNDDDDASPGNENSMHPQPNWARWAVDLPTMAGYARDASGFGPWRYCTTGAFLSGQILQRATHTPVDRYIEQKVLSPLGTSHWTWPYSPAGEVMTGGGLRLRSRDLAKIAAMLADDGRWQGRQVVPAAWVDAMLTVRRDAYPGLQYGYFFWRRDFQTPCGPVSGWYMAGNGGNAIVVLRGRGLRAAVVVTRANYNTHGMHDQTLKLLETYVLPSVACVGLTVRL
jgi:CubicO group peptidase (beta-lactamase class C family)